MKNDFPTHLLVPLSARHWPRHGPCGLATIHIALQPFSLQGERVETSLRLDGIALELDELRAHENKRYPFPVNPQDGYIDGSLYLQGVHVPVDITALDCGAMQAGGLPVRLTGSMALAAAGIQDWRDTPVDLSILLEPPPTPAQIDAAVASAIAATGALAPRDAGKVMAWLSREHPNWEDRRALHENARLRLQAGEAAP